MPVHPRAADLDPRALGPAMRLPAIALYQRRLLQLHADQYVQNHDQRHRHDEEEKGRELEGVMHYYLLELAHHVLRPIRVLNHAELQGLRKGADQRDQPYEQYQLDGPRQFGHRLREERMADGDVSLDRERCDRQHGGVRRRLGGEAAQNAKRLAEDVGVLGPDLVDLGGHAKHEEQQVGYGQAEEVVVGGGVHGLVARDDDAGADVAHRARHEDRRVDYADRYHHVQRIVHRTVQPQDHVVVLLVQPTHFRLRMLQRRGAGRVVHVVWIFHCSIPAVPWLEGIDGREARLGRRCGRRFARISARHIPSALFTPSLSIDV